MTRILLALLLVGCSGKVECKPAGAVLSFSELRACPCPNGTEPKPFGKTGTDSFFRCVPVLK